jgi:hypothetical protein
MCEEGQSIKAGGGETAVGGVAIDFEGETAVEYVAVGFEGGTAVET